MTVLEGDTHVLTPNPQSLARRPQAPNGMLQARVHGCNVCDAVWHCASAGQSHYQKHQRLLPLQAVACWQSECGAEDRKQSLLVMPADRS